MNLKTSGHPGENGSEVDLREVWSIVRRQWWVLVGCTVLGVVAALVLLPKPEAEYDASALIRIEERRDGLAALAAGGGSHLETEMQVIRSRTVLAAVVDSLQLQIRIVAPTGVSREEVFSETMVPGEAIPGSYRVRKEPGGLFRVVEVAAGTEIPAGEYRAGQPIRLNGALLVLTAAAGQYPELEFEINSRERAVDGLASAIEVSRPTRNADIVQVAYRDASPVMARNVVNTVVDRFLRLRNDAQKTEVRSTIEFLTEQIAAISVQLSAAEDELRRFRETAHVIDPTVEGSTQVTRLAELQAARSGVEAERVALQALVAEIERAAAQSAGIDPQIGGISPYRRLAAFPTLMQSQAVSDVLRSLSTLENERANLVTRRRPEDQDVQVLSMRIRDLEEQLRVFVSTYLAGLSSQVASTDATLSQYGDQLARLPANEVEFARLSRQPKLLGEMHALLQTRLQEAEVAQAVEDASVRIVDPAVLPVRAVTSARWKLQVVAVSVFGLLLGIAVGFVREFADRSVYTRSDVQSAIGVPVLGLIPRVKQRSRFVGKSGASRRLAPSANGVKALSNGNGNGNGKGSGVGVAVVRRDINPGSPLALLVRDDGPNPVADAYDRLHTNILFAVADNEPRTLLLTSPLPGDGKTTTATNLAVALARRGLRTLLIDADLRRGQVSSVFGGERSPGLAELLLRTTTLGSAIQSFDVDHESKLYYIASGEFPKHPASLVGSTHMQTLLAGLESRFDRIIIDSPPVNIVADAAILARFVDGVVVVARAGVTPQESLALAAEQLSQAKIHVVGAVLNDIDFERHGSYDPAYKSYSYGKKYYAADVGR
jgi:succinoglycan biosynthesis transport protein ExoP